MKVVNCERERTKRNRTTLSITVDRHVLDALKQWMGDRGERNLSAVIEGFIDCGIRDTCEGCPDYEKLPQDEKDGISGKLSVGKREEDQATKN